MPIAATLGLISGDSHVNEPRNLWRDNLPKSLTAMSGIRPGEDGSWDLFLADGTMAQASDPDAEAARMVYADPAHRFEVMREEGIVGECVYPTVGLYTWALTDPDAGAASCRVYNEWIADQLGGSPRFKCAGLIPTWRIEDAVTEVGRIVDANLGSIMLPAVATPDWNHPNWSPLWSAIEESGLPAVIHQGTGHSMFFYRGKGAGVANLFATQSMGARCAALLATSGVLASHPGLHVVFVEYNAGWLAWTMQTLDFYTNAFSRYGTVTDSKWVNRDLPEPPSHYLRHQVHATFQDDPIAISNASYTGTDPLIWGSDYPHEEGTYPHSRDTVKRLAGGLGDAETSQVFRDNAARLFHFSDDVLNTPV
jgi:predicted TIM-barrel fold metal-dependent hydrolase